MSSILVRLIGFIHIARKRVIDKAVSLPETARQMIRLIVLLLLLVFPLLPEGRAQMSREQAITLEQLIVEGKLDEAEQAYLAVLEEHPGSLLALSNLGVVYYRKGEIFDAIRILSKAVRIAPKDGFSHRTLGMCYLKVDELDLAITSLEEAIKLNPSDFMAHNFMGIVATKKGWWKTAETECRRAIELNKDYMDAYFNLAVVYSSQEPPRKVLGARAYREAVALGAERSAELEKKLGVEF
ncbi:MAG: tetratricopeptide repeat protein [Verrucomicrobiota bacterium]